MTGILVKRSVWVVDKGSCLGSMSAVYDLVQFELMEGQSQENEFVLQLQKLLSSQACATLWAGNMDLLALATYDNLIQLYRISFKAQKVFQSQQAKPIKAMAFSPNSQLLAYGLADGSIKLVKTENGEQILSVDSAHSCEVVSEERKLRQSQVECLTFLKYCELESTQFMPFQKHSLQSKLILNISPHKNCNRNAIVKINYFAQLSKEFTILLSSEKTKTAFLLNGFLPFAEINYAHLGLLSPRVLHTHYDGKLRCIVADEQGATTKLWLVESEAKVINQWRQPIIKASCLLGYVLQSLSFVQSAYDAAELIIRDALRQYNSKINLIDDPNIQNINPCEELFRFLNCGTTSTAIVNFFTKEVYDSKILQKLDETMMGLFGQLHDLLLESIQNGLERADLMLSRLKELCTGSQRQRLGLNSHKLASAQSRLIRLYTMGEALLVQSTEAKFDIRNLLVWLNKSTIKSGGENEGEIENSKSYLNKYTVDFARLHAFLNEERKFKLQNLLAFFNKTNDSHPIHIQKPDFQILAKGKSKQMTAKQLETFQEMALLFEVEDQSPPSCRKMAVEQSYRSFKAEMKQLQAEWRQLVQQPIKRVSSELVSGWRLTAMGQVEQSELFPLQLKAVLKQQCLVAYFVQRLEEKDRLVQFNCQTYQRSWLTSSSSHILSVAVAEQILVVLEDKFTMQKLVAQVVNEAFDEREIVLGKRISRTQGELDVSSSQRGLNSLIVDKNKLIIFD